MLPAAQPVFESVAQGVSQQDGAQVTAVAATGIAPSQIKSAATLFQDRFKMAASRPSIVSASKTIALDNHEALSFPPAPGFAAKQGHQRLKSQLLAANRSTFG